jgi:hypothetical protein
MVLALARLESRVGTSMVRVGTSRYGYGTPRVYGGRVAAITFMFRGGLYYVLYIGTTDYVIYDILSYTVSRGNIAYTGLDGR